MADLADRIRPQDRRDRERKDYCAFGCDEQEGEPKPAFGGKEMLASGQKRTWAQLSWHS